MWETDERPGLGARALVGGASVAAGFLRLAAPQVFRYASGQQPALHFSWGAKEYRLGREGLQSRRRTEQGWEDNPRSNYNDAVEKKQTKKAKQAAD
jgi:hypothetical protein